MFLQSLVCSPCNRCFISRDMMQRKGQRNRATVRLTASVIHHGRALSDPTNVVGILGGDSSLIFAKKLIDHERELPFVLCMEPALINQLLSLQKGSLRGLSGEPEEVYIDDHWLIVEKLRRKRVILEKCGVCCIVMPCHLLQCWHDEIEEGCTVPFIHMGESVAEELKEAKLRPIEAGSALTIGLLATNTLLVTRMYQQKLENEGFEVLIPDTNTLKHIVIPAVQALSQKDFVGATNLLRISLHILLVRAVNRVVLASDEFRELLPSDDPLWRKCIDPMDALARSTVKYAQSVERRSE
ncbi:broad specificity amino-acid racemase RacX-like [Salvia hispanica]|uniref:broad specificity amino-acid racemase RacX-like n=1 Tax=Salvia hispanica TaxID=49212 RepID=UPI00200918DC|nr:broad specificity amino-acid racemase RacX-like [Salvia hispanica]